MNLIKVKCAFCGKDFFRTRGRINEAKKFGWKPYCSLNCQYKYRTKRVTMKCGNSSCNNIVNRELRDFKNSKSGLIFCSRSCAATVNNVGKHRKHGQYQISKRICSICNKVYYQPRRYCSKECYYEFLRRQPKQIKISSEQIIKKIQDFYKNNSRIPVKREFSIFCTAQARFGSWNKAIKAAGFEPNPVLFAKKQIAKDGHKCDSFSEKIIDDWLSARKIKHKRNVSYPENTSLSTDFVTAQHWIEFFGLAGDIKRYDELMAEKMQLAEKYKLPFVAIFPKDLFPVNRLAEVIKG